MAQDVVKGGGLSRASARPPIPLKQVATASMVISRNPLAMPQPVTVKPFTRLRDLAPDTRSPLVLRHNGAWLLRADWDRIVAPGDMIEWHELLQGGNNDSRTVLQIVVLIVSIWAPGAMGLTGWQAAATSAAINIGGTLLVNAILPIQQPNTGQGGASPGSVYSVTTSANQARLGQPIPVIYGRQPIFPDYAAQPYIRYVQNPLLNDGAGGGDQYFYALFTIGQGHYNIPALDIYIDDTPLSHFSDVAYVILPPGVLPTRVHANVSTAVEVAGQPILSGRYTGGFAACRPGQQADGIGIDVLFDRLGVAGDDGGIGEQSATVRAEYRTIDDYGIATGAWALLTQQTITGATTGPMRFTYKADLPAPARVEVRMVRVDERDESDRVFNDPVWGGMRAYLTGAATLCPTATHMEVIIRASEQLSGLSQRKIKVIPRRLLRTWHPDTGFSELVETRNPAWALLDAWTDTTYGEGLAAECIDLDTLYAFAQTCDARQDRCDIVFDSRVTSDAAARTIARCGRAVPFKRWGINTLARDGRQTLPVTAFTTRNMQPGASIGYALPTETTADAVIAEYFDGRSQDWREVMCPAPGVTTPANPVRVRYMGITGRKQAEREGLYEAAQNLWRRKFPRWQTELMGMLPAFGSLVVCVPPMATALQAGDVVDWDDSTLTLGLTEPTKFEPDKAHYIVLQRDDGSITPTIAVTPGPTPHDVILADLPDFDLVCDDPNRERPKYVFGTSEGHRVMTRVLGIRRQGKDAEGRETIELSGVVEDDRIHDVDLHLLPSPGEIQDPIDSPNEAVPDTGAGTLVVANLLPHEINSAGDGSSGAHSELILLNNGTLSQVAAPFAANPVFLGAPREWLRYGEVEAAIAGQFEARVTVVSSITTVAGFDQDFTPIIPSGDPVDTWLNLGTTRHWWIEPPAGAYWFTRWRVDIREASTGVVQASNWVALNASNYSGGGGSGGDGIGGGD
jgi:hypothetical protein